MSLHKKISNWLNEYLENNKLNTFVVGVSGGIDSAVTSALCAQTGKKTIVITMPIHQNQEETIRGKKHIEWLKNNYEDVDGINIDLTNSYEQLKNDIPKKFHSDISLANTRARIRMSTLYLVSSTSNGIVVGTGNKVEDFGIGFFTKYGDGGVDISPIADLMKSEVYQLGKDIGIIDKILKAQPTDGLWDDKRTDEDQLGASYDQLEWAMECNIPIDLLNDDESHIMKIYNKHRKSNIHKMNKIPVFKK